MGKTLTLNQEIFFIGEKLPMIIKAMRGRFAICVRAFDKKEDNGFLVHAVKSKDYFNKAEAYKHMKDYPVYSILDFIDELKAPDNYGGKFDYKNQIEIDQCMDELHKGETELSRRHHAELKIDWNRTKLI